MKKIELTGKNGKGKFALIDNADFNWLNQWGWHLNGLVYVSRYGKGNINIKMHREIMEAPKGMEVDHINGNTLDNRRQNLRLCSHKQNSRNRIFDIKNKSSIYKGVTYNKARGKWTAQIMANNKKIHIGLFSKERHAAVAWDIWAKELFGEFARLNFNSINI